MEFVTICPPGRTVRQADGSENKTMSKIFCNVHVGNSDCTLSGEHFKWSYGVGYLIECAYDS